MVLEKTLESPLDCKEIQPVHSEGDQPWDFFGRNDAKAETPVLWLSHAKSWLTGKDSDAGRDWGQEEKGTTEDEMAGWHHRFDGFHHGARFVPGHQDLERLAKAAEQLHLRCPVAGILQVSGPCKYGFSETPGRRSESFGRRKGNPACDCQRGYAGHPRTYSLLRNIVNGHKKPRKIGKKHQIP